MARSRSKRHAHPREKYMLKEQRKTDQGIFDEKTMIRLSKFFNKGIISALKSPIARGKEADIYLAEPGASGIVNGQRYVLLKFFRVEASSFHNMMDYIYGDPRFERQVGTSKESIIKTWCKKEFGNLSIAAQAGVHAPVPYMFNGNIIAMQFIGEEGMIAPTMNDTKLNDPERMVDLIIDDMRKLYRHRLVHADISEYNILIWNGLPYVIDFGQAVSIKHPNAKEFLVRDVENLLKHFRKRYKIKRDAREVLGYIILS